MTEKNLSIVKPDPRSFLKNLTTQDFLNFGIQDVAYMRPVDTETGMQYAIYAADGTLLSVMESLDSAMGIMRHNDLEPMTLH